MTFTPQAAVRQVYQFGIEDVPGVAVPTNKRFHSLKFDMQPKIPGSNSMQSGNLFPVGRINAKEHTEADAKGAASVQDILYILSAMSCLPTFSLAGALAHKALFAPDSFGADSIHTLTCQKGIVGSGNADTVANAIFNDLTLDFVPDKEVSIDAKLLAAVYTPSDTLTADPVSLANSILQPRLIDVFIATAEDGLAGGQVEPLSAKFSYTKTRGDVYALNSAKPSFSGLVQTAPGLEVDLEFLKSSESNGYLANLRAADLLYLEILARGSKIETVSAVDYYDQLRIRMPIRFADPGESDKQDARVATFKAMAQHDPGFNGVGGALLIECQSVISAL